jgi:tetratricopeptide (TPR) repeat protein
MKRLVVCIAWACLFVVCASSVVCAGSDLQAVERLWEELKAKDLETERAKVMEQLVPLAEQLRNMAQLMAQQQLRAYNKLRGNHMAPGGFELLQQEGREKEIKRLKEERHQATGDGKKFFDSVIKEREANKDFQYHKRLEEQYQIESIVTCLVRIQGRLEAKQSLTLRDFDEVWKSLKGNAELLQAKHQLIERARQLEIVAGSIKDKHQQRERELVTVWQQMKEGLDLEKKARSQADMEKAASKYSQTLEKARRIGNSLAVPAILTHQADIFTGFGQYDMALKLHDQAISTCRPLQDLKLEAAIWNSTAGVYVSRGQYQKALEFFEQSLAAYRKIGDWAGEIASLGSIGHVYGLSGQYQKALALNEKSLENFRKTVNVAGQASTLSNMATVYQSLGQYQKALEFYEQSLAMYQKREDVIGQTSALSNIAAVYQSLGQYQKALESFERSLGFYRKLGDVASQASALSNIAAVYQSLGQYQKALELYEQSLVMEKALHNNIRAANVLRKIAELGLTTGDTSRAEAVLTKERSPMIQGRLALMKSDFEVARANYQEAVESGKSTGRMDVLLVGHTGLGLAYEGLRNPDQAARHFQQTVELIEELRESLPPEHRTNFYEAQDFSIPRTTAFEGLARALLNLNKFAESLKSAESTKARLFSETISQRTAVTSLDVPAEVLEQDMALNTSVGNLTQGLQNAREKGLKEAVASFEEQLTAIRAERDKHISKMRQDYPLFAATKYPQPIDLKDSALKDDEWVIEYQVTDSGVCIYLVQGKKIIKGLFKPIDRKALDDIVRKFMEPLEGVNAKTYQAKLTSFDLLAGKKLSDVLLSDMLSELPREVPVIIVADACLGVVPFEMLVMNDGGKIVAGKKFPSVSGAEFFGDRNSISYYQSITALTLARTLGKEKGSGKKLLVMADPVFDISDLRAQKGNLQTPNISQVAKDLNESATKQMVTMIAVEEAQGSGGSYSRLKETANLANALGSIYIGGADIFTGFDATKDTFLKKIAPQLEQYREIVFATHGYFGKNLPGIMEPVLMLTAVPPGTDGHLRLSEVMGLRMNADTVALTACMSGLGRTISGEGVMGMGRAFQYAGAKSVLMSLWSVHEDASVKLVEKFFRHIKEGTGKLEAIKLARAEIRKEGYDHPFFWAPFILVGEVGSDTGGGQALPQPRKASTSAETPPAPKTTSTPPPTTQKKSEASTALMSPTERERNQGEDVPKPGYGTGSKPPTGATTLAPSKPRESVASRSDAAITPLQRDSTKDKELLDAARAGDLPKVHKLLSEGADPTSTDDKFGATPLHWASYGGHQKVALLLLDKGANVNATNKDRRTPLMLAAGSGRRDVVELLLRHKAEVTIKDKDGKTALDWAKNKNDRSIVKLLKK